MNLREIQTLCDDDTITEEQLEAVNPIYCLLDFDKSDFCQLVKAIGIEKWLKKTAYWKRLDKAHFDYEARQRYLKALARLEDLHSELEELKAMTESYEHAEREGSIASKISYLGEKR